MLEAKKRDDIDRVVLRHVNANADVAGGEFEAAEAGDRSSLQHSLVAARANEHALRQRLHRVRDPKGMELLRGLRAQISRLEELLGGSELDE